ncbi:uroporphyrinogen-III C-methyltransferase [Paramaledivibacter caminithermalis]|jgi:uroporphyrinogen III methyltransferase/synthase|uniref:uroporphyrinogen-III C-methyltransferase n=1 Tax=Paramaledivibacter caminithermalis (strain DSM 15212 / CIP 107654 / DViRD3) TaxID=1121301 RepID=A0A1M6MKU2_PARC5|nr:uroporphyrinogen-III C-methyltransferase [Paramaledivibacter caminithermalis]SHJ84115.1 uroporphyrinogen III methyltransferase / synthase [Paramaledivibacter caminithermalis DSM 15212]
MGGKVYLVGAGPGDYKLITLKGLECIENADVVLYDRLINPKLLKYAKKDAEIIYVGKAPNAHSYSQEEISRLILEKALEGNIVTRLKGGDPFVFGRGGEEALLLTKNNVEFEIVPGITSAISVPAYAGIPVTHRNISSAFHIITGHEDPMKEESSLEFEALGKLKGTLIFLMGIKNIDSICKKLIKHGQSSKRPVAVIRKGTTMEQEMLVGTLQNISAKIKEKDFKNPAIIIVGEVVNLSEALSWVDKKKLFGKRVLVTRTRSQASKLSKKIESLGGEAIEFPTIEITPKEDYSKIDKAIGEIEKYKWIIFTSINGVKFFFDRMKKLGFDIRLLKNAKLCAIGPATANKLNQLGLVVECIPDEYRAESIVEALKDKIEAGDSVLLPRADIARRVLEEELLKLGAKVDNIHVYKTTIPEYKKGELVKLLKDSKIDIITFTSSSTVKNFYKILGEDNINLLNDASIAAIGPITAKTARELNIKVDIEAKEYTIDGLVDAIVNYYSN